MVNKPSFQVRPKEICLGIISDTHMPQRWRQIPAAVYDAFSDVDMILHAGDVGKLWVLDELSQIAPVIAVHGNDETVEATQALPYQQVLPIGRQRIMLTHSHFPDRAVEMESRKIDDWQPKLARLASMAKAHGATVLIYGHTHVPMALEYDGVWLINPGAIASGGHGQRQKVQSVAKLRLSMDAPLSIEHIHLKNPDEVYVPPFDLNDGFIANFRKFSESILAPDLEAHWDWLFKNVYPLAPEPLLEVVASLAFACWEDGKAEITLAELMETALHTPILPETVRAKLREVPELRQYA